MIKSLVLALATTAGVLGATSAHAGVSWSVGINAPGVTTIVSDGPGYYGRGGYGYDRVYAPAPVYVQEPVYAPVPVYRAAPPVEYYPAPVYYQPQPIVYGGYYRGDYRGWGRGHEHDQGRWHHEHEEHERSHDRGQWEGHGRR